MYPKLVYIYEMYRDLSFDVTQQDVSNAMKVFGRMALCLLVKGMFYNPLWTFLYINIMCQLEFNHKNP